MQKRLLIVALFVVTLMLATSTIQYLIHDQSIKLRAANDQVNDLQRSNHPGTPLSSLKRYVQKHGYYGDEQGDSEYVVFIRVSAIPFEKAFMVTFSYNHNHIITRSRTEAVSEGF